MSNQDAFFGIRMCYMVKDPKTLAKAGIWAGLEVFSLKKYKRHCYYFNKNNNGSAIHIGFFTARVFILGLSGKPYACSALVHESNFSVAIAKSECQIKLFYFGIRIFRVFSYLKKQAKS